MGQEIDSCSNASVCSMSGLEATPLAINTMERLRAVVSTLSSLIRGLASAATFGFRYRCGSSCSRLDDEARPIERGSFSGPHALSRIPAVADLGFDVPSSSHICRPRLGTSSASTNIATKKRFLDSPHSWGVDYQTASCQRSALLEGRGQRPRSMRRRFEHCQKMASCMGSLGTGILK